MTSIDQLKQTVHEHSLCGGALCVDDGFGSCRDCAVLLSECDECGGLGYHLSGCPESEDDAPPSPETFLLERP